MNRGFTLVELMVSIAIFVFMTALVLAKYGNFNSSTLLTDLAYDVALTVRTAQTYGVSVENVSTSVSTNNFNAAYGVYFDTASSGGSANSTQFILFADKNTNGVYDGGDQVISTYAVTGGAKISGVCGGTSCSPGSGALYVTFKRPDPSAIIYRCTSGGTSGCASYAIAQVVVAASNGSTRIITINQNGEISVGN